MESSPSRLAALASPTRAYTLPFIVFIVITMAEGHVQEMGLYPILYGVKVLLVAGLWWWLRGFYPEFATRGLRDGVIAGVLGVVVWVGLSNLRLEATLVGYVPFLKYLFPDRSAYNPFEELSFVMAIGFLMVRFFGLVVAVPLMEEVFWRGWLTRYLIDNDFEEVAIGEFTPLSFAVVTLAFALVHPEFLAALAWGAGINYLLWRTKNLWACVVAHLVTNLLLGIYILATGSWSLW